MGSETSTFSGWLRAVDHATQALELVPALEAVAELLEQWFRARLWFVELLGRRWSYIAGGRADAPVPAALERVALTDRVGLVADAWGTLSSDQRQALIAFLRQLVSSRNTP